MTRYSPAELARGALGALIGIAVAGATAKVVPGGPEALPFLERYPGRAVTVHLKEYAKDDPKALIGEGDVPFEEIFRVCESTGGTKWYIVEQESYAYPPMECADRCLQTLRAMGK